MASIVRGPSLSDLNTRFLASDVEGLGANPPVLRGVNQAATRMEVAINEAVTGNKVLRPGWRLETQHLALSPPRRSMRVVGTIVRAAALSTPNIRTSGIPALLPPARIATVFRSWLIRFPVRGMSNHGASRTSARGPCARRHRGRP
jgi:hypothetical protein